MRIVIGSDHFGFALKDDIRAHLEALGHDVVDLGVSSSDDEIDYPDVGTALAVDVSDGKYQRGILICGTGIGMAITANKVPGVRAAVCHDPYSAERARKSNDAQIMAMGSQIVGPSLARSLVDIWLASDFGGGRSARKVEKMVQLDERYRKRGTAESSQAM